MPLSAAMHAGTSAAVVSPVVAPTCAFPREIAKPVNKEQRGEVYSTHNVCDTVLLC